MATDDQQVLVTGQAPAPAMFRVPGNGQIRPKAVFATFDGTSAAGAFLPALKIISDGGETVGIYPTSTAVAAGASADVSWFPRLAAAAGSTPAGDPNIPWAMMIADESYAIDHSGSPNYLDLPSGDFYTNDSTAYTATSFTPHLLPTVGTVQINEPGFYQITVSGNWKPIEAAAVGNVHLNVYDSPTTAFNPGWVFGRQAVKGNDTFAGVVGASSDGVQVFAQYVTRISGPPINLVLWASQFNATANATLIWAQIYIQRISDPIAGNIFFVFPPYN